MLRYGVRYGVTLTRTSVGNTYGICSGTDHYALLLIMMSEEEEIYVQEKCLLYTRALGRMRLVLVVL